MKLVVQVALTFLLAFTVNVQCDVATEENHDELKSESARQKIYDIISSHEDRKYGDHGGHEYEEGEMPRKSASRKYKQYGYQPDDKNYYYVKPKQSNLSYLPRTPVAEKTYVEPVYAPHKASYPVVEAAYVEPKKAYLTQDNVYAVAKRPETIYAEPKQAYLAHDDAYAVAKRPEAIYAEPKQAYLTHDGASAAAKRPESVYAVPKQSKRLTYHDEVGTYLEDKTAPITIGKTARTVYPKSLSSSRYSYVDSKHPSEYLVLDGQKPPRPLILDPKLKETYHHSQPAAHYSAPAHQYILKPEVSIPVHYPTPVKDYEHYDDHHKTEEKGHHESGHGYYDDNAIKKESGHKSHGHHDKSGHKSHSSVASHHDDHGHHHNRGHYERDRGYHYEKAYAYDRVRAHHDIGSTHGGHSTYNAHHGQEAHKDAGDHGAETYSYFKKNNHGSGYGYNDGNSLYKKGHGYYDRKYIPTYYHGR